jgi:cytochrome c biogenesis protein CcmG/thiol:disulfide interchange protein DsbE
VASRGRRRTVVALLPLAGWLPGLSAALDVRRALPELRLPRTDPSAPAWRPAELRGRVWVLNFWATWCGPCRAEHPLLLRLARAGRVPVVPMVGVASMDSAGAVGRWLGQHGNPYTEVLLDTSGQALSAMGVSGVPATFVVDARGRIRWQQDGPLTDELLERGVLPMLRALPSA